LYFSGQKTALSIGGKSVLQGASRKKEGKKVALN
jgi:hypothetical protein